MALWYVVITDIEGLHRARDVDVGLVMSGGTGGGAGNISYKNCQRCIEIKKGGQHLTRLGLTLGNVVAAL